MGYLQRIKDICFKPSLYFQRVKKEPMGKAVLYLLIFAAFFSVLNGLASIAFNMLLLAVFPVLSPALSKSSSIFSLNFILIMVVVVYLLFVLFFFVNAAVYHLFVLIFGGRQGYGQTYKAMVYGATPTFVLGWIPLLGFPIYIYSLVLQVIGFKEMHNISYTRAALARIIPLLIFLIISIIFIVLFVLFIINLIKASPLLPGMNISVSG